MSNSMKVYQKQRDDSYKLVAIVDVTDINSVHDAIEYALEFVFEKTNTIYSYWWENAEVQKCFEDTGCRSTSVGDVVYDCLSKTYYRCESVGWKRIEEKELRFSN